jgi:hypothetical protein
VARDRGRKARKRRGEGENEVGLTRAGFRVWLRRLYARSTYAAQGLESGRSGAHQPMDRCGVRPIIFSKLGPVLLPAFRFTHSTLVRFTNQRSAKVT